MPIGNPPPPKKNPAIGQSYNWTNTGENTWATDSHSLDFKPGQKGQSPVWTKTQAAWPVSPSFPHCSLETIRRVDTWVSESSPSKGNVRSIEFSAGRRSHCFTSWNMFSTEQMLTTTHLTEAYLHETQCVLNVWFIVGNTSPENSLMKHLF